MDHLICAIGDLTVDVILRGLSTLPQWGEEMEIDSVTKRLGGNVGNMAVGAGALHTDLLVVADIGTDEGGEFVMQQIRNSKLDVHCIRKLHNAATSQTYACIRDDGERFLLTEKGTLAEIEDTVVQADIPGSKVVFLGGWCLPPRVRIERILPRLCKWKEEGRVLATDLIWSEDTWAMKQDLLTFLKHFDIVFMNEKELMAVTECTDRGVAIEKLRSLLNLKNRGDSVAVIKLGAEGACLVMDRDIVFAEPYLCKPVDTVGAGDLFNLGFLHAKYQLNQSYENSMGFASTFASLSISKYGKSLITQDDVYGAMQRNKAAQGNGV